MKTVFLVPRRVDYGWRDEVWAWLRNRWESETGWEIYEGHHDDGPFNCAKAINRAAAQGPWDLAVIAGADLVVPTGQLRCAVAKASLLGHLVHAHDHYHYLTEDATKLVLAGAEPDVSMAEWHEPMIGNGPVAITRALWDTVGGYDEGFVGWGYEDVEFRLRCNRAGGEGWVPGPNFHLWHPVAADATVEGASAANRQRYIDMLEGVTPVP